MDYPFEANIIRSLGKIIEQGHLKRGDKPVHWCFDCKSALAEAEVEYQENYLHPLIFFPIKNSKIDKIFGSNSKNQSYFASWTTTFGPCQETWP